MQSLKHTTENSAEQTVMRTKWFKHIAISTVRAHLLTPQRPARGKFRRPHSAYQKVVQGKCPLHFLHFNGVICSNILFSNTSALTNSLLFRANSPCKVLEHLVWSNPSGLQFWGPLARANFLSALCGLPTNVLGEPRGGMCPSDCDPQKLSTQRTLPY